MGLEINQVENCLAQNDSSTAQSVHYHDFDDATDTTFAIASMWNAGIRVFDVRDPVRPTEVAYFNPGDVDPTAATQLDQAWAHNHYDAERGEIWFSTASGGFWVVRLEGKLREHLALDAKNVAHGRPALEIPLGDPGSPGTSAVLTALPESGTSLSLAAGAAVLAALARRRAIALPTGSAARGSTAPRW